MFTPVLRFHRSHLLFCARYDRYTWTHINNRAHNTMSIDNITEILAASQLSNYIFVSALTLLIVDWLAMLDVEIKYAWRGPWKLGKILFFLARYLVFFITALGIVGRTAYHIPPPACSHLYIIIISLSITEIVIAETIMLIRVLALWGQYTGVKILVVVVGVVSLVVSAVASFLPERSFTYPIIHLIPSTSPACSFGRSKTRIIPLISLLIYQILILVLTLIKGLDRYRTKIHGTSLIETLYHDGILYFISSAIASFSMIAIILLRHNISLGLNVLPVLLSILSTRMLLHLRRIASKPRHNGLRCVSAIQFAITEIQNDSSSVVMEA